MNTWRYGASWLLAGALATTGCVGSSETRRGGPQAAFAGPVVNFEGPNRPLVVGRAQPTDDACIRIAWAGTAATLKFYGNAVSVDITDSGENQYLVLIDGKPKREKIAPSAGRSVVELVKGLPRAEHTVTLYKLTEPLVGTSTIHGFILDKSGEGRPQSEAATSRIEILGDSISAGYGNEGNDEHCGFSPETENHFLTYGARAARELGVDLTTIAWSGKGVFSNRGSRSDTLTLPRIWDRTLPAENVAYDFSAVAPRAVIINLGTNDFAPEVADNAPFGPKMAEFVSTVRERYPEATLIVALGPMLSDEYPAGKTALTTVRAVLTALVEQRTAAGDANVHFLEFARAQAEEGLGCDYHPSAKTHARMAATLARVLRDKAGL